MLSQLRFKLLEIKERQLIDKFSTIQFQLAGTLFSLRENRAKLNLQVRPPPTSDKLFKTQTFSQSKPYNRSLS